MLTSASLRDLRKANGWSQLEAARHLHVSQPYLSLLEKGERPLTPDLLRRLRHALGLPPTVLPLPDSLDDWPAFSNEVFVRHLSALGYPPFSYVKPHPRPENPTALLLWTLNAPDAEARLVEGLPWILLSYPELDLDWLLREAKLHDLQNRLGFFVHLAHTVATTNTRFASRAEPLAALLETLEHSRLAREETLFGEATTAKQLEITRALRGPEAAHWNLVTLWKAEHLNYD
jgi:transcriptional regulator with XRE-family HTH domain